MTREEIIAELIADGWSRDTAEQTADVMFGPMFGDTEGGWK